MEIISIGESRVEIVHKESTAYSLRSSEHCKADFISRLFAKPAFLPLIRMYIYLLCDSFCSNPLPQLVRMDFILGGQMRKRLALLQKFEDEFGFESR